MPKHSRRKLGDVGEELAAKALIEAGLEIVERNWMGSSGELDIVAREIAPDYSHDGRERVWLALVEVRTRRGTQYGTALQSITPRKQAKLREVASEYVESIGWEGPWRIDAVGVQMDDGGRLLAVEHIRHAVMDG